MGEALQKEQALFERQRTAKLKIEIQRKKELERKKKERGIKQFEKAQEWRKLPDQKKEEEITKRFEKWKHLEVVDLAFLENYSNKKVSKKKRKNRDMAKAVVVAMDDLE